MGANIFSITNAPVAGYLQFQISIIPRYAAGPIAAYYIKSE
jgi:hypothetical protein